MLTSNPLTSTALPATPNLPAQILEVIPQAIYSVNLDGVVTSWNTQAQRLYGFEARAVIGKTLMQLCAPEAQLPVAQHLRRALTGQPVEAFATRHLHRRGHPLHVRVQLGALTDAFGAVSGAAVFIEARVNERPSAADHAPQAQADEDAQTAETHAQLALLLETQTGTAVLSLDAQGRITRFGADAERLFGREAQAVLEHGAAMLFAQVPLQTALALLDLAATRERVDAELMLARGDGARFWARVVIAVRRAESQRLAGYTLLVARCDLPAFADDGTSLTSDGDGDAPLEPDAVLITDACLDEGPRIVHVNRAFGALSGFDARALIGQTPRVLQGEATDRTMLARLRATLERGGVFAAQTVNYRRDRTPYRVRWEILPLLDPATGAVTRFFSVQQAVNAEPTAFVTALREVLRVSEHLSHRAGHPLHARLEAVGGADTLAHLVASCAATGTLRLDDERALHFQDGRVVGARHPQHSGLEAALAVVETQCGAFVFEPQVDVSAPGELDSSVEALLTEAAQRRSARAPSPTTPPTHALVVLRDLSSALAFASGVGLEHFRASLEPHAEIPQAVVLRGRGFKVVALEAQPEDLPGHLAREG